VIAIGDGQRMKLEITMEERGTLAEALATHETASEMQHVALE